MRPPAMAFYKWTTGSHSCHQCFSTLWLEWSSKNAQLILLILSSYPGQTCRGFLLLFPRKACNIQPLSTCPASSVPQSSPCPCTCHGLSFSFLPYQPLSTVRLLPMSFSLLEQSFLLPLFSFPWLLWLDQLFLVEYCIPILSTICHSSGFAFIFLHYWIICLFY